MIDICYFFYRNIIDVSALDTHLLEQSEYNDRIKIYTQRLAQQWNTVQINDNKYNGEITLRIIWELFVNQTILGLLKDIPNPEILLASNQNLDEIAMVCFINYLETDGYIVFSF